MSFFPKSQEGKKDESSDSIKSISDKTTNNTSPVEKPGGPKVAGQFTTRKTFVATHPPTPKNDSIQHQIDDLLHPKHHNKTSTTEGGNKRTPRRSSLMDTEEEESRMREYRERTKQQLASPAHSRDYATIKENDDASMTTMDTDHEFQNLVADTENTTRNAKCEIFGKYGVITVLMLQALVYVVGISSLVIYALYVRHHSPALSTMHSVMPIIFHGIGIGSTVLLKTYYDFSRKVGHLESMQLIIRSRLWLFPGVLGAPAHVKRSELEEKRREEIPQPSWDEEDDNPEFGMTHFLKRCQFPEFRLLFRAFELYPYSHVTEIANEDLDYADQITNIAQNQIMRVFPILDFLDVAGSLPAMANPVNWFRLTQRFGAYLVGKHAKVLKPDDPMLNNEANNHCYLTRSEELEEDDVGEHVPSYAQRSEPHPWGTVRLHDYEDRFKSAVFYANFLGFVYYFFSISAYMIMVFGEVNFYTRLSIARRNVNSEHHHDNRVLEEEQEEEIAQEFANVYDDDDYYSWSLEYQSIPPTFAIIFL